MNCDGDTVSIMGRKDVDGGKPILRDCYVLLKIMVEWCVEVYLVLGFFGNIVAPVETVSLII